MTKLVSPLYGFTIQSISGEPVAMSEWQGKVVLIVNTASQCGFTPQYEGLERLYQTYHDRGFVVLGFPCNQFGQQESGNHAEIAQFCQKNYGVSFPLFEKVQVNGDEAHPLFVWLKSAKPGVLGSQAIKWNFTKFLIDREGSVVNRYAPQAKPEALIEDIERLL